MKTAIFATLAALLVLTGCASPSKKSDSEVIIAEPYPVELFVPAVTNGVIE